MRSLRYLGVETSTGEYSSVACAASTSKLGFEWRIQSTEGLRFETVTPSCKDAIRRGVPVPKCGRRVCVPVAHLEDAAAKAARDGQSPLREKLRREDLVVTCKYLGVVVPDGFDKYASAFKECKVGFEWTLAVPQWDWKEEVSIRVKDFDLREVPLPHCSVTRQRLVDLAQRAAQTTSATYGIETSCTYPLRGVASGSNPGSLALLVVTVGVPTVCRWGCG